MGDPRSDGGVRGELEGQVALITGGSAGIGLATALRFAEEGASVAILARGEERLREAAAQIDEACGSGRALPIVCDVTDESALIAAFQRTLERFGRLDILVNNAGGPSIPAMAEHVTLAQWRSTHDVHVLGYFLAAREAIRTFRRQDRPGSIVFIASDNAVRASKEFVHYNTAKAAELHMARCLADEYGPYGIRVNSILPGAVFGSSAFWTPAMRAARAKRHGVAPEQLEEKYAQSVALRVIILPEEVAEVALFLAGPRSAKMTGAALSIDGGGPAGFVR